MKPRVPTLKGAKSEAKALREKLASSEAALSHAQALERLSHQYGFRDWNTFHAAIVDQHVEGFAPGDRVQGRYLSQPFDATVLSAERLRAGWFRVVLDLDQAVDVVTFDSFTSLRKRVRGTVGPAGTSRECTSDGKPHLEIDI